MLGKAAWQLGMAIRHGNCWLDAAQALAKSRLLCSIKQVSRSESISGPAALSIKQSKTTHGFID
ncbi:MAG: hypothetical protein EB116_05670, partial [Betaproteobacteria bacterium]|nr:hypothetical protein [Betaproteobacteria bacterium]